MVRQALALATGHAHTADEVLWPKTPSHLRPPLDFIVQRISACYIDFVARAESEQEDVPGLEEVLREIRDMLDANIRLTIHSGAGTP